MKSYLLATSKTLGTPSQVEKILDEIEDIEDWRSDLPYAYYLRSSADATILSAAIKGLAPKASRFMIVEVTDNSDGFVTGPTWPFLLGQDALPDKEGASVATRDTPHSIAA